MKSIAQNNNFIYYNLIAPPMSDAAVPVVLVAGVQQELTIPTGAKFVAYSANEDFYAEEDNASIAVPSATGAASGIDLNPDARAITPNAVAINLISPFGCVVVARFYA